MSIWNKVRENIRAGISWAFSSYEKPKSTKSEDSAVIRRKAEPKTTTKRVRARTVKGRYQGDDKSTSWYKLPMYNSFSVSKFTFPSTLTCSRRRNYRKKYLFKRY